MLPTFLRAAVQRGRPQPASEPLIRIGGIPQKQSQCRQCRRRLPLAQLVYVNHCWHSYGEKSHQVHYDHHDCAGLRVLCQDCHNGMSAPDRLAYYEARLAEQGAVYPPEAVIGLRKSLAARGSGELGHAGYGEPASA